MGIQQINPLGVVIGEVKRQHSTGQKESHQDTEACTHTRLLLYVNLIKGKGKKKERKGREKKISTSPIEEDHHDICKCSQVENLQRTSKKQVKEQRWRYLRQCVCT